MAPPAVALARAEEIDHEHDRILRSMRHEVWRSAEAATLAIRAEVPGYRDLEPALVDDVHDQVRLHQELMLERLHDGEPVGAADLSFVRSAAMRRARAGIALEDYISAFQVGQRVVWEAVLAWRGDTPAGHEAATRLATPVMQYIDVASTHAAHAYVEFRRYAMTEAARGRRDLLERLLTGELPESGALLATACAHELTADARLLAVVAVPVGSAADPDAAQTAGVLLARASGRAGEVLAAVRHGEVVALPVLGPGEDPRALCATLEGLQARLAADGVPLAMGISTVAHGVAELPRAYAEARDALGLVRTGGVSALPTLSAFQYLAANADDTTSRLVAGRVRAALAADARRGGALRATVRAWAAADLKLGPTAEALHVHPNTAQYRLRRIHERTGLDPRRVPELMELLVALAVVDRED